MTSVHDRAEFEAFYADAGTASAPPWEIGRPQPPFIAVADQMVSPILDAGCGAGDTALDFASRGHRVIGIDFIDSVIARARAKAAAQGLTSASFETRDALALGDWDERFNSVIDSGLFHVLSDDDRVRYVNGLAHVLNPGGRVFLECFSDRESGEHGPRRVSQADLRAAFADGWDVESIDPATVEVNPAFMELTFSEGGPKAWFAVIRRHRQPPVERFAAEQHAFDLRAEIESLKAEHAPSSKGHRQKTLYKRGNATIAIFRFERGGGLATHKTNGTVTIHVVEGTLRIGTHGAGGAAEHVLSADQLVVLAPNVPHDVHALEDSTMLLQVHLDDGS